MSVLVEAKVFRKSRLRLCAREVWYTTRSFTSQNTRNQVGKEGNGGDTSSILRLSRNAISSTCLIQLYLTGFSSVLFVMLSYKALGSCQAQNGGQI